MMSQVFPSAWDETKSETRVDGLKNPEHIEENPNYNNDTQTNNQSFLHFLKANQSEMLMQVLDFRLLKYRIDTCQHHRCR